ncbi:DUF1642 domain-containing protein [Lacticaseibacillus paracasei]|uniref:DUF1642 domain-containing protein n=1 Tax=Lacticaseibacillus paracasei TaxID=1597 RepID=UPI003C2E8C62
MSEEKLYAVKNDEGQYWEFGKEPNGFFDFSIVDLPITFGKHLASEVAKKSGGHVVTLVEEPEKVLLSKEQAKIVEEARIVKDAHGYTRPAKYITENAEDAYASERILMEAYVNGYTVAKEKKYNVKVPHAEGWHFQKYSPESKRGLHNNWRPFPAKDVDSNMSKNLFLFTEAEIEHYGLQDCEKEEVTDDDD